MSGKGTVQDPWKLTTPVGKGTFEMHIFPEKNLLHCQVGANWLQYRLSALDDLHAMLVAHGDWMELGNKDEKQKVKAGTVEAWARSDDNPVGGWYGLRRGYRGGFADYVTPVLAEQGRAEFEKRGKIMWVRAK
jgi:Family of unknown function (DUF6855)